MNECKNVFNILLLKIICQYRVQEALLSDGGLVQAGSKEEPMPPPALKQLMEVSIDEGRDVGVRFRGGGRFTLRGTQVSPSGEKLMAF